MLTDNKTENSSSKFGPRDVTSTSNSSISDDPRKTNSSKSLVGRALRMEWLGQMMASLFWIASVFTYGISSSGDWLQLLAASAWMIANIATLLSDEA